MKSAGPHLAALLADESLNTVFHFLGGLVGKGDRQDIAWGYAFGANEICDAIG
jgi:hypothetical protein